MVPNTTLTTSILTANPKAKRTATVRYGNYRTPLTTGAAFDGLATKTPDVSTGGFKQKRNVDDTVGIVGTKKTKDALDSAVDTVSTKTDMTNTQGGVSAGRGAIDVMYDVIDDKRVSEGDLYLLSQSSAWTEEVKRVVAAYKLRHADWFPNYERTVGDPIKMLPAPSTFNWKTIVILGSLVGVGLLLKAR